MVIVDTTVWIDYLRGAENPETHWLERELRRQRLGLTDFILCQVLQGIPERPLFAQVRDELLKFHVFETGGTDLVIAAAQNYRDLRRRGYTCGKPSIASLLLFVCRVDTNYCIATTTLIRLRRCWVCMPCMHRWDDSCPRNRRALLGGADEASAPYVVLAEAEG
jgi:predicted nucleic acid-binding protein